MKNQTSYANQALKSDAEVCAFYEKHVVTYCHSRMQAAHARFTLKYLGYNIHLYEGSMSQWNAKGAPLEK